MACPRTQISLKLASRWMVLWRHTLCCPTQILVKEGSENEHPLNRLPQMNSTCMEINGQPMDIHGLSDMDTIDYAWISEDKP